MLTPSPAVEARAVVLCRKKARILVRDTACKPKETQVTLGDLGLPSDVVTQSTLSTQLAGLVTQSTLSTQLAGLVTQSALSTQLAGLVTQSALTAQLSSLTGDNITDRSITLAKLADQRRLVRRRSDPDHHVAHHPARRSCQAALTANFGEGVEGNMVIGTLTNSTGQAVRPTPPPSCRP